MAAPSIFTQEIADAICTRLMEGASLRQICKEAGMPGQRTVYQWLNDKPNFQQQYARAREVQADTLADEILDISNTPELGKKTVTKASGIETTEGDMTEHRRLKIDARKWLAGKLAPKKYGDKITQEIGGIGGGPVETMQLTAEEAYKRMLHGDS